MYINVENLVELCGKYSELEAVRDITARHGEKSEISLLCELIAKLYERLDGVLTPATKTGASRSRE